MDNEAYLKLEEATKCLWDCKIGKAEEFAKDNLQAHPAFRAFYAEIAVIKSMMTEEKKEFAEAASRLQDAKKAINAMYANSRVYLKGFVAKLPAPKQESVGNANNSNASSSNGNSSNSSESDAASAREQAVPSAELSASNIISNKPVEKVVDLENETYSSSEEEDEIEATEVATDTREDKILQHVSNAFHARLLLAEVHLWSSMIKFKLQKYVKGMLDFRSSWKKYEECSKIADALRGTTDITATSTCKVPLFAEICSSIYFGIGIFHFGVSAVPRHFQWIVEGIGFAGNRNLAIIELKSCIEYKHSLRDLSAGLILSWIHAFFFYNCRKAQEVLATMQQKCPEGGLIHYTRGYVYRKQGLLDDSVASFNRAHDAMTEVPEFRLKVKYELGYNACLRLEWSQAIEHLELFMNTSNVTAFKAYCGFQLALAYLQIGQPAKTKVYMKKLLPAVRKNYAYDEYAERKAKQYLKGMWTDFHKHYQVAVLLHEACSYEKAIEYLGKAEEFIKLVDHKVCHHFLLGSCMAHLKKYDEANKYYTIVLEYEKRTTDEGFAIPWSCCGLAEIHILNKEAQQASVLIKKAKSFKNFDFENFLTWRVRKAEDDIQKLQCNAQPNER